MREYDFREITAYKNTYKLQWCDFVHYIGGVSEQSVKMWAKGYPKPREDKMKKLFEMFDILDSKRPKQRWQAFVVLGFGEDYEG